jgi:hypothetical protein
LKKLAWRQNDLPDFVGLCQIEKMMQLLDRIAELQPLR